MVFYPGGIISSNPVKPSTSSASGLWSITEQLQASYTGIWPVTSAAIGSISATMLIVAGGGGGGGWLTGSNYNGGGGGAGGLVYNTNTPILTGANYTIVVGAGGTGGPGSTAATNGSNSSITGSINYTAIGGGAGGSSIQGQAGGSGGGATGTGGASAGGLSIQNSTFGYGVGFAGGANPGSFLAGGGGGSANVGGTGSSTAFGGVGSGYNFANGTTVYYAGGGSGGSVVVAGNLGGGGASGGTGSNGNTSSGGGGGGSLNSPGNGGAGGSGTVILSYPLPQQWTGGIVTNNNGANVVHTFTTSSTMTALATPIDTYQPYNTLLVHADGTNGSNNSVFLDSSTNNLSITKTGTPTQGTFSPFSTTGWSNYFNGTTDYLTPPSSTGFALSTGDFTIECWIYPTAWSNDNGTIIDFRQSGGGSSQVKTRLFLTGGTLALNNQITTTLSSLNTWYHIALVRSSGSTKLYVNGVQGGSTYTDANDYGSVAQDMVIGQVGDSRSFATGYFAGYISNVRIVKGTAVYTAAFTPPLAALTAITNTSILTCQSNKFVDNSANGLAITIVGTPQVQPFSPFNSTAAYSNTVVGGSMYFNGTTDYVQATVSAPGTSNFTMEGWVYLPAFSTGSPNIFSIIAASSSTGFQVYVSSAGFGVRSNVATIISPTGSPKVGQWYHVALVRSSGTIILYLNGASAASTSTAYTFSDTQFNAGWTPVGQYLNAYISNIRYVNGIAVYTGNFTPPTALFTSSSAANTALLLNGTNAGIIDSAQKIDLSTYGSAAISTTQSKFGGSSMYFPGTSYVRAPHNAMLDLSTGAPNFTVECWFYTLNNTASAPIVSKDWGTGTTNPSYGIYLGGSTTLVYMIADGTSGSIYNYYIYTGIAINTWYHVALVRNGSTMLSFLNGVLVNTQTISITSKDAGATFNIGTNNDTGSYFNGYIDEVRITKGIARYTSNFTPQTTAFLNT